MHTIPTLLSLTLGLASLPGLRICWWRRPLVRRFLAHLRHLVTSATSTSGSGFVIYGHLHQPSSAPSSVHYIQLRSSSPSTTSYHLLRRHLRVLMLLWTFSELGYMIPANWVGVDTFSSRLLTDCPIYCMHVIPSFYLQVFCSELLHCDCWSRMDASTLHLLYCCIVWHFASTWAMPTWF